MKRYNPGVDSKHKDAKHVVCSATMDEDANGEYVKYSDLTDFEQKDIHLIGEGMVITGTISGREMSFMVEADVIRNFSIYNFMLTSDETEEIIKSSASHIHWEPPKACLVAYEPCCCGCRDKAHHYAWRKR